MTLLRSPALHFALIGLLWFVFLDGGRGGAEPGGDGVEIPWAKAILIYDQLAQERRRPLTPQEEAEADQLMKDQEALYRYSRDIGLDADPVIQRRLAQIAEFVAENPHENVTAEAKARQAVEYGLMDGDPVTRRVMIDGARRLIRATALVLEPDEASLEQYRREHEDEFQVPARTQITHVTLNHNIRGVQARPEAERLLTRFRDESVAPEHAATLGDPSVIPAELGLIPDRALERRFGRDFVVEINQLPTGSWQGPVRSRVGEHLVFIEERISARPATLEEVRDQVSARMRNAAADQALRARLDELQERYQIRIERPPS